LLDLYQKRSSPIHRIDARVKIIFTLAFILVLTFLPSGAWPAYILLFTISTSIAQVSRIGFRYIQKRALLAVPFVLSAIPLIFLGPPPIDHFSVGNGFTIPISNPGIVRFVSITLKSWISVQMAILLASSTPFLTLLTGFRSLKVPGLFISIIELMWRYLFLMFDEVARMLRARNSRSSVNPSVRKSGGSVVWRASVTGGMAGSLFIRSIERSERVYAAMLSRGYTGEPYMTDHKGLGKGEWFLLILSLTILSTIYLIGFLFGV